MGRRDRDRSKSHHSSSSSSPSPSTSPSSSCSSISDAAASASLSSSVEEDRAWKREFEYMQYQLGRRGMMIKRLATDGNCMFRALSDQLMGTPDYHHIIRQQIVDYMEAHAEQFEPFIDTTDHTWSSYLCEMRQDATWGDHLELTASCRRYHIHILLHHADQYGMHTTRIYDDTSHYDDHTDIELIRECREWDAMATQLIQQQHHRTQQATKRPFLKQLFAQQQQHHKSSSITSFITSYQHIMSYPHRILHFSYHRRAHYNSVRALHDRDIADFMHTMNITSELGIREGIIIPSTSLSHETKPIITHTKYQPRHRRRHHTKHQKTPATTLPQDEDDEWVGIASRLDWDGPVYLHGVKPTREWPRPTRTTWILIVTMILLFFLHWYYNWNITQDEMIIPKSRRR